VVLIERDRAGIDAPHEELDVGFIHGNGTHPAILLWRRLGHGRPRLASSEALLA